MKYVVFVFLGICMTLTSLELIDKDRKIVIDDFQSEQLIQVKTEREKDGEVKNDEWMGVPLSTILMKNNVTNFDQLIFTSSDQYLVRIKKNDINDNTILATMRNGKKMDGVRLIDPDLRDMFWINDLASITTELLQVKQSPTLIYNGIKLLAEQKIISQPGNFINSEGYYLDTIISDYFPILQGEFFIQGIDGVSHKLDYQTYLKQAVLLKENDGLFLKSPAMPAGMWIKNFIYLQKDERAVLFSTDFDIIEKYLFKTQNNNLQIEVFSDAESSTKVSTIKEIDCKNYYKLQLLD